jgi:hypothetical protein
VEKFDEGVSRRAMQERPRASRARRGETAETQVEHFFVVSHRSIERQLNSSDRKRKLSCAAAEGEIAVE